MTNDADERLWHPVPRLDSADRLWLLPLPVAQWLLAGVFSGPVLAQALPLLSGLFVGLFPGGNGVGVTTAEVWSAPLLWLFWATGLLVGCLGAWCQPGGLTLGRWAAAALTYRLRPRRAIWQPGP